MLSCCSGCCCVSAAAPARRLQPAQCAPMQVFRLWGWGQRQRRSQLVCADEKLDNHVRLRPS